MKQKHAIAGLTFQVLAQSASAQAAEIQLLPDGDFRGVDGRPWDSASWRMNSEVAARLISKMEERKNPLVIDYDHHTLSAIQTGQRAPAAGWFKKLEYRQGQGVFAVDVEWTEAAQAAIKAGEYRYISPVIRWDKETGEILDILNAGLVNFPNLKDMQQVEASAAQLETNQQEAAMNEKLLAALGLKPGATEEEALSAVEKLKVQPQSATPDPSAFVPMAEFAALQAQFTTLSQGVLEKEVTALVDKAIGEGRLLPAQKEWATNLGKANMASLQSFLSSTPAVAGALALSQTDGKPPAGGDTPALSETELAVCAATGVSQEDFMKSKQALEKDGPHASN